MYIDKDDFTAWMERIMDRFDMQDKKIDRVIKGRNCLDGEELLDNQDLCLLLKVEEPMASPSGPTCETITILSARSNHLVKWSILDCSITLVNIFLFTI